MMKKLLLTSSLAIAICAFGLVQPADAHFAVEDTDTGVKAMFHITPNHDPVAGKESIISFDFSKTGLEAKDYTYALSVKSTKHEAVTVPLEVLSNVILAKYVFPSQGFYGVRLVATSKDDGAVSNLQYGQRVSRGVVEEESKKMGYLEIGAIAGTILIVIGVVAYSLRSDSNKRKGKRK